MQINDSTTVFYYAKRNIFYIAAKDLNTSLKPYVKYIISNKKEKAKVASIGRGDNQTARNRFIQVSIIKAEKINGDSRLIEDLLK